MGNEKERATESSSGINIQHTCNDAYNIILHASSLESIHKIRRGGVFDVVI
jgi:hypothetical protein